MKTSNSMSVAWFITLMIVTLFATFAASWLGIGLAMFVTTVFLIGSRDLSLWLLSILITCVIGMAHLWLWYQFDLVANVFVAGALIVAMGLGVPLGIHVQRQIRMRGQ